MKKIPAFPLIIFIGIVGYVIGRSMLVQSRYKTLLTNVSTSSSSSTKPSTIAAKKTEPSVSLVDPSWKTYANGYLHFAFSYPVSGPYAAEWQTQVFDLNDRSLDRGCIKFEHEKMHTTFSVQTTTFCHTESVEVAAGSAYVQDAYATTIGSHLLVIRFLKQAYSASALDCPFVATTSYSARSNGCLPFVLTDYQAMLDTIINTYHEVRN